MTNRRQLLIGVAALLPLAACQSTSGTTPSITPAQVVTIMQNATMALNQSFTAVEQTSPTAIPPSAAQLIGMALTDAGGILGTLSASLTATQSAPIVQKIEGALNDVVMAAAAVPLIPPPFSIALAATSAVLPIVEAWLATVMPQSAGLSEDDMDARMKLLAANPMTSQQAEATLAKMAGK